MISPSRTEAAGYRVTQKGQKIHVQRPPRPPTFLDEYCFWLKYAVLAYSIALGLLGVIVVSVGVWILSGSNHTFPLTNIPLLGNMFKMTAGIFMGFGAFIILIALLGGCGALRQSPCMTTAFSILLCSALFVELAGGVWVFQNYGNENAVTGGGSSSIVITAIGFALSTLYCCFTRKRKCSTPCTRRSRPV